MDSQNRAKKQYGNPAPTKRSILLHEPDGPPENLYHSAGSVMVCPYLMEASRSTHRIELGCRFIRPGG